MMEKPLNALLLVLINNFTHDWPCMTFCYQSLIQFATRQIVYNSDGIWIHKLVTRKYTRKTFHAYLEMRELYYAGGVLFISGRGI